MANDQEETTSQDHQTMSGNEPYRSASDESPDSAQAGSLYGSPRSNERVESEREDTLLSLNDDDSPPATQLGDDEDGLSGLDLREPATLGNRPASGARVVSVSEVFSEHFMGAEGASDFLGLDTEFDPTPVGTPGSQEFVLADVARATATEDEYQSGIMSPLSSPESDPSYASGAGDEFGDDLSGGDEPFADEPLLEEEDFELKPARRLRPGKLIGAVCALGAVAALAVFVAPRFLGDPAEPTTTATVARATPSRVQPGTDATPAPAPAPDGAPSPVDGDASRPLEDFSTAPSETLPVSTDPLVGDDLESTLVEAVPDAGSLDPDAVVEPATPTATELELILAEARLPDSFYQAHTGLLDLVWRGETVPLDAIRSPNRILTPAAGPVRVYLASGSVFDGRLFAVGENKVWVDSGLGRMGLDGTQVIRIDALPRDVALTSDGLTEVVTGERVRAQVPGGVIYGFVRSHSGNEVTLITESGARITLIDPVLETAIDPKRVSLRL
jgi:hypothetical protein